MDTSGSYTRATLPQQPHPVQNDDERCAYIGKDRLPERGLACDSEREYHHLDAERKDDVLDDDVARASRQPDGVAYPLEVIAHERDVGCLERRLRAGRAHRDAYGGTREGGRIVDAVADHGDSRMTLEHRRDRKSTRLNSSHVAISYAVFCLKKKKE